MKTDTPRQAAWIIAALVAAAAATAWQFIRPITDEGALARGNGRIEATEVDVAAKMAGRVQEILVNEGDFVQAGDIVARMDLQALEAQLAQAVAEVANAHSARETARALVAQRKADVAMEQGVLVQSRSDLDLARETSARSQALRAERAIAEQIADENAARLRHAEANITVPFAKIAAAEAAVRAAAAQVAQTSAAIEAAKAVVTRLQTELEAHRAPAGDAGDALRNHAVQGVVDGRGGADRLSVLTAGGGEGRTRRGCTRLGRAVRRGDAARPVRRGLDRRLHGHAGA